MAPLCGVFDGGRVGCYIDGKFAFESVVWAFESVKRKFAVEDNVGCILGTHRIEEWAKAADQMIEWTA